jgi:hypothetical protein
MLPSRDAKTKLTLTIDRDERSVEISGWDHGLDTIVEKLFIPLMIMQGFSLGSIEQYVVTEDSELNT